MIPRLDTAYRPDSRYLDFATELRIHGFEGDIQDAYSDRTALATDNSIYQVFPQLALYPKHTRDLERIVRLAAGERFRTLTLYPRGGGTGTNGQSLGDGAVVDLSRHMNRILEINAEARWARVEAGVVKDQLEAALKPHGLFFAPELSTSNRATLGGMVNTDASGQGSCVYGKTRDHVLSLTTVLMDGTVWTSTPLDEAELDAVRQRPDLVGRIHRGVDAIQRDNAELIRERFPKLNRCLTGYDLAHIRDGQGRFDLNSVLCGSEGSLGFIAEAKLNLLPIPTHAALIVVRYASLDAALRDAPRLLQLNATSIETLDAVVLRLARQDNAWPTVRAYFPDDDAQTDGVNLVEFTADRLDALDALLAGATARLSAGDGGAVLGHAVARGHDEVARVWTMRKRAVGLLGRLPGEQRPIPFVEDTAVPPEHLADYIAEFRQLLDGHGVRYGMFGHADAGVLHVRPALDMKDPAQAARVRTITDAVVALTQKYGGVLWGEHGKGLRSEYAPAYFGPLYPKLQQIKALFDPHNQLNPGKIVAPPGAALLKLDAVPLRGHYDRTIAPATRRQFDDALHCNGNGACFNVDPDDAMCPSWKATRDRRHSPKGRAALLREWLRLLSAAGWDGNADSAPARLADLPKKIRHTLGRQRGAYDFSHEVKDAMATCLACKSCAGQCPIKVDVPRFRSRFLALYHSRYLRPPKDHLLGLLEAVLPWLARAPRLVNALMRSRLGTAVLKRLELVHVPALSGIDLVTELERQGFGHATPAVLAGLSAAERARAVIVVQDAFTTHFDTAVVIDTFHLLRALGFRPLLAPYRPNGKPLHVHGLLRRFRRVAEANADMLRALQRSGLPLVGIDPAMTLTYRSEYPDALGSAAAPQVRLLQEWLAEALPAAPAPAASDTDTFLLLAHCTEKTNVPDALAAWRQVFAALGARLQALPSGCCGMSGTFGHEAEHRAMSDAIYRLSWASAVAQHGAGGRLMATGYSCRCQVKIMDGVKLPHPVQVLLQLAGTTGVFIRPPTMNAG